MRQRRFLFAAVVLSASAIGCGSDGGNVQDAPDASPLRDASPPSTDGSAPVPSDPSGPPPPLQPRLLLATYVGGAGNQYLRSARIEPDGAVFAAGDGFSVRYDAALTTGVVDGDLARDDGAPFTDQPPLRKQPNTSWTVENGAARVDDPRSGLSYFWGTQQVSNNLQQPIFLACAIGAPCAKDAFDFRLWGWWASLANDLKLTADSRAYELWLLPGGRFGLQGWTDGGNSLFARDPRRTQTCTDAASCTDVKATVAELGWSKGTWQELPDGVATVIATVDPRTKGPTRMTFLASPATRSVRDAWGRTYFPRAVARRTPKADPENPFGQAPTAGSGLFVLDETLRGIFNARLGGACAAPGQQSLGTMALVGNRLVLAGTTCATDLPVTANAVSKKSGGAQDGYLVVLDLW